MRMSAGAFAAAGATGGDVLADTACCARGVQAAIAKTLKR